MCSKALTSPSEAWDSAPVREIAEGLKGLEGPLLPILHAINDRFGHVDERALPVVAEVLNLSRAEVHGVATFYHDFRRAPAGRHVVRICRAEACQALGAERLYRAAQDALGADGTVTVEPVYCLGNCALGPSAMVDGALHGRVDLDTVKAAIEG